MYESIEDDEFGYWAAFGYQNHLVPEPDDRRAEGELIGVCGVKTSPEVAVEPDSRPTCSVCSTAVRDGSYLVIANPRSKWGGGASE